MQARIEKEKRIVNKMITSFCLSVHKDSQICETCESLIAYAEKRLLQCPFLDNKPVCSNCNIHCYNKNQQDEIKLIMRTMGPKMILINPLDTIWYFYYKLTHKFQRVK